MSWSDNRTNSEKIIPINVRFRQLEQVNGILHQLSKDNDLQDDLQLEIVKKAIDHWTNVKRFDREEAQVLQDDHRVKYVFNCLFRLQQVCKDASIPTPLDHMIRKASKLHVESVIKYFGEDLLQENEKYSVFQLYKHELNVIKNKNVNKTIKTNALPKNIKQEENKPIEPPTSIMTMNIIGIFILLFSILVYYFVTRLAM
jgi:hypothetical protein